MSRVRFWPWPPSGCLPGHRAAAVLTHRHPCLHRGTSTSVPLCTGPAASGDAAHRHGPTAPVPGWGVTPSGRAFPPSRQGCPCPHRSSGRRRPSPSRRVPGARRLGHAVCAGGGPARLGVGPSRRALGASVPAGLAPSPGGSCGARTRVCPHDVGLPHVRTGAALGASSVQRRQHGRAWRGCSHARLCKPAGWRATPVAPPPGDHGPWAAMALPSEPLTVRSLPVPRLGSPSASGHGRQRTCTS